MSVTNTPMTRLEHSTEIKAPPEEVYSFFSNASHFPELFPGDIEVKKNYQGSPEAGDTFDMTGQVAGRRLNARVRHVEAVPNARIVLEQVSGDFKSFREIIVFGKTNAGTRATAIFEYDPPYSFLGQILDAVKIRRDLERYLVDGLKKAKERLERSRK